MKINNKIISILLAVLFSTCVFAKDMTYLKIGLTEGFMVNSYEGQKDLSLGFTGGIVADLGYKHDINEKSDLLILYEINYDGPGLKGSSKESFNARGLDHFFLTKYTEKLSNEMSYYIKADFFYEFYRIAKSESWTDGLYNFGKTGAGFGIDWNTSLENKLGLGFEIHYFWFPNYSDLTREAVYLLGTANSQLSSDSVNQNFIQLLFKAEDFYKVSKDFIMNFQGFFIYRFYPKLTIDENSTSPSTVKQKDFTLEGLIGLTYFLSESFSIDFKYNLSYFHSNYNYLYLDINNIGNSNIYKNFSSYIEQKISIPLSFIISEKSTLSLIPGVEYKKYIDRPAKDINSNYGGNGEQYQYAFTGGLIWTYKKHENLSIVPQYMFKLAKSNNKDPMMGFNYTAHYLGIQLVFEF